MGKVEFAVCDFTGCCTGCTGYEIEKRKFFYFPASWRLEIFEICKIIVSKWNFGGWLSCFGLFEWGLGFGNEK